MPLSRPHRTPPRDRLAGAILALSCALSACRNEPRRRPPPQALASAEPTARPAPAASTEAPIEERAPTLGPAGDLRDEIDGFVDLRSCVAARRVDDPLLADTIEALGYDDIALDACRSIEALKHRDAERCAPVVSPALRRHCRGQLAIVLGDASLCPVDTFTHGLPSHEPTCLAAARRDVRPCNALSGMARITCEGLVARDVARCGTDPRCLRVVRRYRELLPAIMGKAPHPGRITLEIDPQPAAVAAASAAPPSSAEAAAVSPPERSVYELSRDAELGATLVRRSKGTRLVVGNVRTYFHPGEEAGIGLSLDLPALAAAVGEHRLEHGAVRLVARTRRDGVVELATGSAVLVRVDTLGEVGAQLKLSIEAQIGHLGSTRALRLRVDTWLRDALDEPSADDER